MGGQVCQSDLHLGKTLDRLRRQIVIVLAAHRKGDAAAGKALERALKGAECVSRVVTADLNTFRAVLPQHAAPQRVVEIENDDASRLAQNREDRSAPPPRKLPR